MKVQLLGHRETYELSFKLYRKIRSSGFKPDAIVAIARGGFPVARYLCDFLDVKNLVSLQSKHYEKGGKSKGGARIVHAFDADLSGKKLLLADDVNDSGGTLVAVTEFLKKKDLAELKTAVIHHKEGTEFEVDFYAEKIIDWRWITYPWAMLEDVSEFIREENLSNQNLSTIQHKLKNIYDLVISIKDLEKVVFYINS